MHWHIAFLYNRITKLFLHPCNFPCYHPFSLGIETLQTSWYHTKSYQIKRASALCVDSRLICFPHSPPNTNSYTFPSTHYSSGTARSKRLHSTIVDDCNQKLPSASSDGLHPTSSKAVKTPLSTKHSTPPPQTSRPLPDPYAPAPTPSPLSVVPPPPAPIPELEYLPYTAINISIGSSGTSRFKSSKGSQKVVPVERRANQAKDPIWQRKIS